MNLLELGNKYQNAHDTYLKYNHTNKTNDIEAANMPLIISWLSELSPSWSFIEIPDCLLNYIGIDIIGLCNDKLFTYDVKICNGDGRGNRLTGNNVLVDVLKKDRKGNWHYAFEDKINDWFIFKNADNLFLVNAKIVMKKVLDLDETDLFFMPRDLKKTTKKAIIKLDNCRMVSKYIGDTFMLSNT